MEKIIRFIDIFAGMGGTRIGFEQACETFGLTPKCVFTSEIKQHAIRAYKENFGNTEKIHGDITQIEPNEIPDFEYLLAGFPCQPFSSAGNRHGFLDERGGLFFTIIDILKSKFPEGFLLENVDGLVSHNQGETIKTILKELEDIGYKTEYRVINSADFGVPQKRKRVYIVGNKKFTPKFSDYEPIYNYAGKYIDYDAPVEHDEFTRLISQKFQRHELEGKSIKDKRGGSNNIHSWDLELKGSINERQKALLSEILKKRRYKKWAKSKGIDWMDGMPLTVEEIRTFNNSDELEADLIYLTELGYLKFEHPKKRVVIDNRQKRVYKTDAPKGYNIVSGKLSFPISKIIHPKEFVPTIVATETGKLAVATDLGVRRITIKEGLRFSGFPDTYKIENLSYKEAFDLLGNTVMPPVIKYVSKVVLGETNDEGKRTLSVAI